MVSTLVLIYFVCHRLGNILNTNCVILQGVDPEISSILTGWKTVAKVT